MDIQVLILVGDKGGRRKFPAVVDLGCRMALCTIPTIDFLRSHYNIVDSTNCILCKSSLHTHLRIFFWCSMWLALHGIRVDAYNVSYIYGLLILFNRAKFHYKLHSIFLFKVLAMFDRLQIIRNKARIEGTILNVNYTIQLVNKRVPKHPSLVQRVYYMGQMTLWCWCWVFFTLVIYVIGDLYIGDLCLD